MYTIDMSEELKSLLLDFKERIMHFFSEEVVSITLFGSQARGNAKEDSDVDLFIVTKNGDWQLADKIGEIAYDLLLEKGIYISTKVINSTHYSYLQKIRAPFVENVLREGIVL